MCVGVFVIGNIGCSSVEDVSKKNLVCFFIKCIVLGDIQ